MRAFDEDDDGHCGEEEFVVGLHRFHAKGGNLLDPTHSDLQFRSLLEGEALHAMLCYCGLAEVHGKDPRRGDDLALAIDGGGGSDRPLMCRRGYYDAASFASDKDAPKTASETPPSFSLSPSQFLSSI